jgi:hypothetical protein
MEKEHPFTPGTRVALKTGFSDTYVERFVEKTYKTGHFTLRSSPQRYRPSSHRFCGEGPLRWSGYPTGDNWGRTQVLLWDATTDKEISDAVALQALRDRLRRIQRRVERIRVEDICADALGEIEMVLPPERVVK